MIRVPKHRSPTHPGQMLLEEFLTPMGLSQGELADAIHVPYQQVNEIIDEHQKDIISAYLERVERDPQGAAARLYPYLSRHPEEVGEQPKLVLIDPRVSFGKPVLVGVGVPTAVIGDRYSAGETVRELAKDYGCEASEIEKAIQYEHAQRKAA